MLRMFVLDRRHAILAAELHLNQLFGYTKLAVSSSAEKQEVTLENRPLSREFQPAFCYL